MFPEAGFGLSLILVGVVITMLVWVFLRILPRRAEVVEDVPSPRAFIQSKSTDGVIVVESGGKVEYLNDLARSWFGLGATDYPDLERLARRVRPSEDFLELCVGEAQKRFSVGGRLMDAVSYQVPGLNPAILISLRSMELDTALNDGAQGQSANSILEIVTGFNQAVSSSLDLETTLLAIFQNVSRLVANDMMEIKLENPGAAEPLIYRYEESSNSLRPVMVGRSQFEGYTGTVRTERRVLHAPDGRLDANGTIGFVNSYIGVPLMVGDDLLGTLELGQNTTQGLSAQDAGLLGLVSGQIALAIRNAQLFEGEQARTAELSGMTKLSEAVGAIQDLNELFKRLVAIIAPLFQVEIAGFLIYREEGHLLEGQVPFQGLPDNVVAVYRSVIQPGSPAEQLVNERQPILALHAPSNPSMQTLGLQDIAQLASIREMALIPLISGERMLGYMQLSNHRETTLPFTAEDVRLAGSIATQAAAIIENALVVEEARQRGQRSESVRRIANLVASSAALDEVLQFAVQDLAQLLRADVAAIYLVDEKTHELVAHPTSIWGVSPDEARALSRIRVDERELRLATVSGTQRPFISGHLNLDEKASPVYRPIIDTLHVESAILVPLMARERSVGELMIGSRAFEFFNANDVQTLVTAGGMLAAAIEGAALLNQTDETLRRRVDQLTAITHVTRELNSSMDPAHLLEVVHGQSLGMTRADCGTILLFEPNGGNAAEPKVTYRIGCPVEEPVTSLTRQVIAQREPVIIQDFGPDRLGAPHADVRSALAAPILQQGRLLGVINLHAHEPNHFDQSSSDTLQTLALQAAVALENANRFQEQARVAEQMKDRATAMIELTGIASTANLERPLDETLYAIATAIQKATPFQIALVSVYEPESGLLQRVAGVGMSAGTLQELLSRKQPLAGIQQLLRPEFKFGRTYFIPADQTPVIPADVHSVVAMSATDEVKNANTWDPDDFLLVMLEDSKGEPLGLLSMDAPRNNLRPDRSTLESLEIFAAQAELAIVSRRRTQEMMNQVDALNAGIQRQQRLLSVTQNDLPILLRKDLDHTIAIHDLDRRAQRIRAGLAITEKVSSQLDGTSALLALGREMLTQLGMSVALIAEETPDGPRLIQVLGSVPKTANPETLFGQRNPLRVILQTGDTVIIPNLEESDEWRETPLLAALRARGVVCLPVKIENRVVAGVMAVSTEAMPTLTDEDRQVYYQIARQTGVVLQNISLLGETRRRLQEVDLLLDFSKQLSGLNPDNIVRALLDSARRVISAAHAGSVLLWDSQTQRLVPKAVAGYADNEGMKRISFAAGEALPGVVFATGRIHRVDEANLARDYPLNAEGLMLYRQVTGGRLPVSSLVIPILAGDQNLGVLVLDNFNTPAGFKPQDETLLTSLSQQVALSLENVRLVQATEERAGQLQALTDVAATITSSLQSRELVASLLDQLVPVLNYDTATLWMREKDQLTVQAARGFPDPDQLLGLNVKLTDSALFKQMIRAGQPIAVGDVREDPRFPALETPRLSWMGIPLMAKGEVIGLIALEKERANYYTSEHIQIATTFASQAAVALENARLFEDSVNRAAELDQRSQRLALLNRFSSALSGLLDTDQIMELSAQELLTALGGLRVSVIAYERGRGTMKLALPRGRHSSIKPVPESPLFDRLRESRGVYTTEDARLDHETKKIQDFLGADTRGLMILPLGAAETRALVLVHGGEDTRFGLNEIELARTIGNQASIALENSRLYQSSVRTAERFAILNQASSEINSSFDPEEIYPSIHKAAQRLMPVEAFVIALLDKEKQEIEGVYLMDGNQRAPNQHLPLGSGMSGKVIQSGEPMLIHGSEQLDAAGGVTYGEKPTSVLAVPMTLGGSTIGMLSAQSYQPEVYNPEDLQILSTLANQAIVAIQNGRLFAETQRLAEELEQRVIERTAQLQREQQNTETLLRILTEVSSSLDLDRALNRTLALLNEAIGAEQGTIMLLNAEDNMLHYRAGYGYLTRQAVDDTRAVTLRIGEGLAGWVLENRQAVLIEDLHQDPRWVRATSGSREHRSCIVAPLLVAEDVIGVLMVFHRKVAHFSPELLNLVQAIGGQVAVAINNAHLYELIRDQAERLGTMLRQQQEEASRSQAILDSVADGVVVTSLENRVTFINNSAERILDLPPSTIMGQTLDTFGGLFGRAAGTWMQTIRGWSEDSANYQAGDSYAEQIELDNKHIILVHLAPVMLQNDFLGTVSIFRDITHEVEVDRLKSEFVATVSHELRTPMTSIKGYTDILLLGAAGALNENQNHFLQIIKTNTERLNILVNDLLDISRIESGKVTLAPQALDLREMAESVVGDYLTASQKDSKPISITLESPRELPNVFGDSERVRQIIDNLVDNAYHYTPMDGKIKVKLHSSKNGEVQVDVSDSGIGIAPEDQERVFERFYRGEHPLVLETPGTGLGLSIVKQLVEMHQGRIWMKSKGIAGQGSTFSFTLPINQTGERGNNGKDTDR